MGARRVIVLGSTGSIGVNTLSVVDHLNRLGEDIEIVALGAGANHALLAAQAAQFGVEHVALACPQARDVFNGPARVHPGADGGAELVANLARPGDLIVAATVGVAGVEAVLEGIARGCDIALANKETLVAAGALVMPAAKEAGVAILPVDSEHSAIFQCLQDRQSPDDIRRIVLTASGGPFRGRRAQSIASATVDEALAHPTWSMGRKITIDSATMVNKALEVIEAHWLFSLGSDRIEAIVHPQSIVHGFVEFRDGSVLAQMGPPDMKTPIQVALLWPRRLEGCGERLDFASLSALHFEPVDHATFPAINMAKAVVEQGGTAGAVFNGANEAAVDAFLSGQIRFGDIMVCIEEAIETLPATAVSSLVDVTAADASAREVVARRIETLTSRCL
ncbi:MAG: 1-deoxy-D-xylulose-5-phosphate reductoisomerase [Phycisphaerales bacterium]|nr:1-deoxy-D-xylulose-5-phosphate reductoisomerase [Phycisphaerales bacterium]